MRVQLMLVCLLVSAAACRSRPCANDAACGSSELCSIGYCSSDVERVFQAAVEAYRAGDRDRATDECRRVLRASPTHRDAGRLLAASLFSAGRFDEANVAVAAYSTRHPDDESVKLVRAAILSERGDLVAARQALDAILPQKMPIEDRALYYNNYAFTLAGLKIDLDLAKKYGEESLRIAAPPDRQFAMRTLGAVHLARAEPQLAANYLLAALKENLEPGDVEFTRFFLAQAYRDLGRVDDARVELSRLKLGVTIYGEKARQQLAADTTIDRPIAARDRP